VARQSERQTDRQGVIDKENPVFNLAGDAVANGLPYEAGLAAITRNPARIYGLDETMGSLTAGKDADIVIWNSDPLELSAFATQVFIAGREIPMVSRSTLLRDRYLEQDDTLPSTGLPQLSCRSSPQVRMQL
jgi:adenine deaminase